MKLLKLLFLGALICTAVACGDDDENMMSCAQSDWVGTYTGTQTCDGTTTDVDVAITAVGSDSILIIYEVGDSSLSVETEIGPLTTDNCDIDIMETLGGITATVDANLDGDNLTLTDGLGAAGVVTTCTITATRN